MLQRELLRGIAALMASPQKSGWQAQRDGDDRLAGIAFVLVQGEARAHRVAVDEAGIGRKGGKRRSFSGLRSQFQQARRHGRPGLAT